MKLNFSFLLILSVLIISIPNLLFAESQNVLKKNITLTLGDAVYINEDTIIVYAGMGDNYIKLTLIYPKRKNILPGRYYNLNNEILNIDNEEFTIKLATKGLLILIPINN